MLAIHTCCADCFLNALENLEHNKIINDKEEIIILFFNPNIHPRSEYLERLNALKQVIKESNNKNLKLVIPNYQPSQYMQAIMDKEQAEKRCIKCWRLRLQYLFQYAKENKIDKVTTTLLTSHYQDSDDINKIAEELSKQYNIQFVPIDQTTNSKHHGFYKQNYCGCCFSLTEKMLSKLQE